MAAHDIVDLTQDEVRAGQGAADAGTAPARAPVGGQAAGEARVIGGLLATPPTRRRTQHAAPLLPAPLQNTQASQELVCFGKFRTQIVGIRYYTGSHTVGTDEVRCGPPAGPQAGKSRFHLAHQLQPQLISPPIRPPGSDPARARRPPPTDGAAGARGGEPLRQVVRRRRRLRPPRCLPARHACRHGRAALLRHSSGGSSTAAAAALQRRQLHSSGGSTAAAAPQQRQLHSSGGSTAAAAAPPAAPPSPHAAGRSAALLCWRRC